MTWFEESSSKGRQAPQQTTHLQKQSAKAMRANSFCLSLPYVKGLKKSQFVQTVQKVFAQTVLLFGQVGFWVSSPVMSYLALDGAVEFLHRCAHRWCCNPHYADSPCPNRAAWLSQLRGNVLPPTTWGRAGGGEQRLFEPLYLQASARSCLVRIRFWPPTPNPRFP